jgi:transcriptional regulator with XRE-family HTH domain
MQLNLGKKIRELRHRDGITQETLAEVLGVTSQAVSRWESMTSYPDMEIVPSIANYFDISIDELLSSDELITIAEKDVKQKEPNIRSSYKKYKKYGIRYVK